MLWYVAKCIIPTTCQFPPGICGTDSHVHEGEFIAKFPVRLVFVHGTQTSSSFRLQLIPGHEVIGTIAAVGKNVKGFSEGDRCVADPGVTVGHFPRLTRDSHFKGH